jgi:site-specific recombinase XerD
VTDLKLKRIKRYRDRHGTMRYYFRRPPSKDVPLPGEPGCLEFMQAYERALSGAEPAPQIGAARTKPGTIAEAIVAFYQSATFKGLKANTQGYYRGDLEPLRVSHGDKQVATLSSATLQQALDDRANHPDAAKQWLVHVRAVLKIAKAKGLITVDPSIGLELPRKKNKEGRKQWPVEYIEAFRNHFPLGTLPRLALELLYCTGQRRSDVVKMGRQHLRAGLICIRQFKPPHTLVEIPILPELRAALDAMADHPHLTFLVNEHGRPFEPESFTPWFVLCCAKAGIPARFTPHGLRKASAKRHADNGATTHELMAWHGWLTIAEAERYTKGADRRRLAGSAAAKLVAPAPEEDASGRPSGR